MKIDLKANRRRREYRECGCIFGLCSKSSASTSSNQQQTAASEGSLAVGAGGKFQESGSVDIGGSGNQLAPTLTASGGNINITSSDADILGKALDANTQLSAGFGSSLNQFVSQQSEDQDKKIASLVSAIEKGKESESTTAANQKTFVLIVLAVLALVGFLGFRRS